MPPHAAEVPLAVNTTRLQASDGTVSIMPGISVWSPWAQQQQQQMPPPQPLGQEQGDHVSHLLQLHAGALTSHFVGLPLLCVACCQLSRLLLFIPSLPERCHVKPGTCSYKLQHLG